MDGEKSVTHAAAVVASSDDAGSFAFSMEHSAVARKSTHDAIATCASGDAAESATPGFANSIGAKAVTEGRNNNYNIFRSMQDLAGYYTSFVSD